MSIQAMAWAIEHSGVADPITTWVLVCLANYAAADGSMAFPSIARLATDTRLSERAVQKHLRKLEELVLIKPGNRAFAMTKVGRSDRLPKVWDLIMRPVDSSVDNSGSRGAPDSPRSATGCTSRHHGVNVTTSRGEPGAPDPSQRSVREPKRETKTVYTREQREEFKRSLRVKALANDLAQQKRAKR